MNNLQRAIEILEETMDKSPLSSPGAVKQVLNMIKGDDCYVLVRWPESQNLMEETWFRDEAIFALGSEDITGSSAYFIPLKRII